MPEHTKASPGGNNSTTYFDDVDLCLGTSDDACLRWETADANAHALTLTLPDGGGTDVPVFIIGRESDIGNVDLGLFNGITVPTLALMNDSATDGIKIYTETFGASENTYFESIAGNISFIPSFAASPSVTFGDGNLNVQFNIAGATGGNSRQTWRVGTSLTTAAQLSALYGLAQIGWSVESRVGRSIFVGSEEVGNTGPSSLSTGSAAQDDPMFSVLSVTSLAVDTGEVINISHKGIRCGTADNADFDSSAFSMSSDRATYDLTISAVSAFTSATGSNRNGANLVLQAGNKAGAGDDGIIKVNGFDVWMTERMAVGTDEIYSLTVGGTSIGAKGSFVTEGSTVTANASMLMANNDLSVGSLVYGGVSRGTHESPTIVSSGDRIMTWAGVAYDGTDYAIATQINFAIDGTPGAGDMPGRIELATTADGAEDATEALRIDSKQSVIMKAGRFQSLKGSDVASADEITLGVGNYFDITGTTTINHIDKTDWQAGSVVMLQFDASVTVTHNAGSPTGTEASILLAGAGAFSATANDTLTLMYDGTTWREITRTVI